jgi:hypothetical protein
MPPRFGGTPDRKGGCDIEAATLQPDDLGMKGRHLVVSAPVS